MSFDWNEDTEAEFKQLVVEGKFYSTIANILSLKYSRPLSKSAAVAKATRLGISNGHTPRTGGVVGGRGRKAFNGYHAPKRPTVIKSHEEIGPVAVELPPGISEFAVPFMKRKDEQCPWPLWAADVPLEQRKVCGADRGKLNYCVRHFRLSINPKLRRA